MHPTAVLYDSEQQITHLWINDGDGICSDLAGNHTPG